MTHGEYGELEGEGVSVADLHPLPLLISTRDPPWVFFYLSTERERDTHIKRV